MELDGPARSEPKSDDRELRGDGAQELALRKGLDPGGPDRERGCPTR